MAVAVSSKRLTQIGTASIRRRFKFFSPSPSPSSSFSSSSSFRRYSSQLSTNVGGGKRAFLVDTLSLVRGLEAQGVPSKQAEAITSAITLVSSNSVDNVSQSFVSKLDVQKIEMTQESNLSQFKSEVKSSQEHHFTSLQREAEKLRNDIEKMRSELKFETEKLRNDMEKMRTELRYEIDKVTAGQRLDLNLERGRIRDELANQNVETTNLNTKVDREITNLTNKIDRESHAYRAQLEASKYEVIKYCIGTFVSISAIGIATLVRVLM